jgi:hypothetical protein
MQNVRQKAAEQITSAKQNFSAFQRQVANDFKRKIIRNARVRDIMKKDLIWAKQQERDIRD